MSLLSSACQNIANFVGKVTQSHDVSNWILDSGASKHLTCDEPSLFNVKISFSLPVILPNETTVPMHSIGQIRLPNMILNHVLLIPSFKCNLLSIRRLTKDL